MTDITATTSTTTTAAATTPAATVIDRYLAAYGESDASTRRDLIVEVFTTDATVTDPPLGGAGHDGIDAMFAAVQSQFADHTFRRTSAVDTHHDAARYEWDLVAADGTVSVTGTDFARFDDSGLITSIVGFFGPVPSDA
ncbi:MAG: nuclear transport factor 2 family protein [Ilumatobacter sp.]|uniref:nuclear transport factor 2 family protein n=1 Tax=Ilumatobacter sp. TaxID=1967498 RepID=UPI003298DB66